MTRRILLAVLLLVPLALCAQEASTQSNAGFPVKVETALSVNASLSGAYLSADPSVVWKPGLFAAGLGAELIVGATQFEVSALPYMRLELGWFYLAGGYVLTLLPGIVETLPAGFSVGAGIAPDPFFIEFGRLGFELMLDTSVPQIQAVWSDADLSEPLFAVLESLVRSTRLGLGVTYSFLL